MVGTRIVNGVIIEYTNVDVAGGTTQNGIEINNPDIKMFQENVTITLTSIYPLKTYNTIIPSSTGPTIVGPKRFDDQQDLAEIRYFINGRNPNKIYKRPLVFKQNSSGSDNIVLNYQTFYQGKKSEISQIIFSVNKTSDIEFNFDNQQNENLL